MLESCEGFIWQEEICTKKFIGICFKKELRPILVKAKFEDLEQCKAFYNMNFILQQREKPL